MKSVVLVFDGEVGGEEKRKDKGIKRRTFYRSPDRGLETWTVNGQLGFSACTDPYWPYGTLRLSPPVGQ